MSFSLPKTVPRFDNDQRNYENIYWGASKRTPQNDHVANGLHTMTTPLNSLFDNESLPMYKDKPYSYASSRRYIPFFRRKRVLFGALLSLAILGCWWVFLRPVEPTYSREKSDNTRSWNWLKKTSGPAPNWEDRREAVKEAFKISWDGYANNAWGMDEYHPLTKKGKQMTPTGMGWIIVDALDTLMIMNLTSRLSHAREWISTSLNYNQDHEVNTFETTIRMLGGLLSAHYLSTEYPAMAPLAEDDPGKPGEDLYLEKAADLADRLLGAFDTNTGVPMASVNLQTLKGIPSHDDGGASSTAEAASLQLEFKYLAMLMGEKTYWEKVEKVMKVIDDNGMEGGLLPIFIYPGDGTFRGRNIRLGSRGDSYYEYLIKQYLQTSTQEPIYLSMWTDALAGIRAHLLTYTAHSDLTIIAERPDGLSGNLSPKMDHLVCFMPGTIALGATGGLPLSIARQSHDWTAQKEEDIALAKELMKTCWGMYKIMPTGLAPEITHFVVDEPPRMATEGRLSSGTVDWKDEHGPWRKDYIVKSQDAHNLQRPETVESLFYMWRITGDVTYREWGWEMFSSFVEHTALESGAGFTSLSKANQIPPVQKDNMESFWLAETLKYFYLLFSESDLVPLEKVVINTEAHVFPRFELQRGLKTGWERKKRDADGRIVEEDKEDEEDGEGKGKKQALLGARVKKISVVDKKVGEREKGREAGNGVEGSVVEGESATGNMKTGKMEAKSFDG